MGLGGYKWTRFEADRYSEIVRTALENGVTVLEAGQEGGDAALANAIRTAFEANTKLVNPQQPITILQRVGYRTILLPEADQQGETEAAGKDEKSDKNDDPLSSSLAGDVLVEEQENVAGVEGEHRAHVLHNLSPHYLKESLVTQHPSPFIQLQKDYGVDAVRLTVMLHNPEAHALDKMDTADSQSKIQSTLVHAFLALQELVDDPDNTLIHSFGIVSNGLGLPSDHPLFLSHSTVLSAIATAQEQLGRPLAFEVVQLPVNLLETNGRTVAQQLHAASRTTKDTMVPPFQVYAMRPLASYTDLGTGTGHPFVLADYKLPATMDKTEASMKWTNQMNAPPAVYELALKSAMAHFDATDIIEAKLDGKELTSEERETLDGCKLLQSLLHDVDHGLDKLRSFAAHEQDLVQKIIPLIHDTFEGYDAETAKVLQSFFGAYSMAVRYSIAKNTRKLLKEGEPNSNIPKFADLEQETRLQEYALKYVLDEPSIDKVILNCTEADQVLDNIEIFRKLLGQKKKSHDNGQSGSSEKAEKL